MRIIAGRYRRRKLLANPGLTTRPITDFVKETIFSRLGDALEGQRVADIFAGTGTIGLECLSRGAASVVFFEKDPTAVELLRRNVASLGAESDCVIWKTNIFRCSFRPKGVDPKFQPFDWIFFDPPFAMIDELQPTSELFRVLKQLAREGISSPDARLVLRTPRRPEFVMPAVWELEQHWPFSHMQVFIYRKVHSPNAVEVVASSDPVTEAASFENQADNELAEPHDDETDAANDQEERT